MRRIFFLPTYGAFDTLHERSDTKFYHLLNESEIGPFARVAMILTLLRGIIDIGEGKRDRGDWRDLTDLWVGCSWLKPTHKMLASDGQDLGPVTRESLRERFALGLQRVSRLRMSVVLMISGAKDGTLTLLVCRLVRAHRMIHRPPRATRDLPLPVGPASSTIARVSSTIFKITRRADGTEALPFYWLAQALLNTLQAAPPNEPGWNSFTGIKYREMLKSSRTFTRMGEGVDTANGYASTNGNGPSMGDLSGLFNDSPAAWDNLAF